MAEGEQQPKEGSEKEGEEELLEEGAEPGKLSEESEEEREKKERLLRLAAEFDNYKKRVAKELGDAKSVGKAEAIAKMLPTLDEFEIALKAMGEGEGTKGIYMVFGNFMNALKAMGLKEIEVDGASDPYKHEVLMSRDSEKKEGTILEVVRKGYTLNGIMLRPASVIVSNGKPATEEKK